MYNIHMEFIQAVPLPVHQVIYYWTQGDSNSGSTEEEQATSEVQKKKKKKKKKKASEVSYVSHYIKALLILTVL